MKNPKIQLVDKILAKTRQEVLWILDHQPDLALALGGALSNAEAAMRMYEIRSIPNARLMDGTRDFVLALACLQLDIPERYTVDKTRWDQPTAKLPMLDRIREALRDLDRISVALRDHNRLPESTLHEGRIQ